jgi:signal peptidase I
MRLASPEVAAPFVHDVLARDGAVWVHESSDSMAPLVRTGDRLYLTRTAPADVWPGELVAYSRDGQLVVHRVLSRDAVSLVTKGDGLARRDAAVPLTDVVARVTVIETPRGRRIELDAFPWPALGRLLAVVSRASERTGSSSGLAWKLTRLPAHLAGWWAR